MQSERPRVSTFVTVAQWSRENLIPAKSLSKSYNSRNPGLQLYLPMNLLVNDTNPEPTGRRSNMNVLTVGTYSRTKMRQSDMPAHYTTVAPHGLAHCSAISTEPSTTRGLNPAKPTLAGFVVLISTGQPRRGTLDTRRTTTGRSVLLTFGSNTNSVNATLQRISTASITFGSTSGTRMELCWGTGRRNWRKSAWRRGRYRRTMSCPVVERLNLLEMTLTRAD